MCPLHWYAVKPPGPNWWGRRKRSHWLINNSSAMLRPTPLGFGYMCSNMCVWWGHNVQRKRWFRSALHRHNKCVSNVDICCNMRPARHVSSVMGPGYGRAFIHDNALAWHGRHAMGNEAKCFWLWSDNKRTIRIQFIASLNSICHIDNGRAHYRRHFVSFSTHTRHHHNGRNSKWAHVTHDCFTLLLVFLVFFFSLFLAAFPEKCRRRAKANRKYFILFEENFDFLVRTATCGEYYYNARKAINISTNF